MNKLKDEDLKILDVKKEKENYIIVHDYLPRVPSFLNIIASPSSGKGVLLLNFLYRFYANIFSEIYWCSPTLSTDNTMQTSIAKDETIIKITDPDDLKNIDKVIQFIIEQQKEKYEEGEELENILIVLDDCISFVKNKQLEALCTLYRHYKITVWVSIQKLKLLSTTLRTCASDTIVFELSKNQLKAFLEEYDIYNNIEHFYKMCCTKPFNWMRLQKGNIYHGSPDGIVKVYDKLERFTNDKYDVKK